MSIPSFCSIPFCICIVAVSLLIEATRCEHEAQAGGTHPLHHINTAFENASPLWWEVDAEGVVHVHLVYDQERQSPNRANGHWNFRIDAEPGADLTLMLGPFANIYNGKLGTAAGEPKTTFVSDDGQQWRAVKMEYVEPDHRRLKIRMNGPSLYVARLQPYRISDLEKLKADLDGKTLVEISPIGNTVQGRELEMIRVGSSEAPHRVLIRARAHPWEPGGNWVIEGLVRRLLRDDDTARQYLATFCLYVMPMANKDGVAHGRTRFNMNGKDLNRDWLQPADPELVPENAALERWLEAMIDRGQRPDLAIDFHNDAWGKLHFPRSETNDARTANFLDRLRRFEEVLRTHSFFTEGSSTGISPTFAGGLQQRYAVPACIHELNADWIAGLDDDPTAANWKKYGEQLGAVFYQYFQQ
ncbi:M14 family zinc carboxypeptidase [Novipirellula artificiosorum]|uniref:Zinc carboxypeptidase n=1 Tax=Novipirellula artificiosorum TaxID=2528016 RepID=A0A5C6D608_9BACT|nr:M14 family zinc carboxypeptidase [Novipirellula artificiosorum]TWU31181.1 Zinc carboxypeptidase [Novipirellula artificiosorum]